MTRSYSLCDFMAVIVTSTELGGQMLDGRARIKDAVNRRPVVETTRAFAATIALLALLAALVAGCGGGAEASGGQRTRTYFIAADEVAWNYAPTGRDEIEGKPFAGMAKDFTERGPDRIGTTYRKAIFREYTNASFSRRKPRPPEWQHLGILGPAIRAEVGDTVRVVMKNDTTRPVAFHVHGLFYTKASEGSPYDDGTSGDDKGDDMVAPGGRRTYVYEVPERSGPGPRDPSSIAWMYHSHFEEEKDTNAGLVGPILVTKRGMARPDGSPKDVDREFFTDFQIFDENMSPLLDRNIRTYARRPSSVKKENMDFMESNLKHSVNGYIYGNLPLSTMRMKKGEKVRWYVAGVGGVEDLHTAHWHGNTSLIDGRREDVAELLPLTTLVADMVPDDPGTWLYHCHVNGHIGAGMQVRYRVDA